MFQLIETPEAKTLFPSDVLERAKQYLGAVKSTGAYSESKGTALLRQQVAEVRLSALMTNSVPEFACYWHWSTRHALYIWFLCKSLVLHQYSKISATGRLSRCLVHEALTAPSICGVLLISSSSARSGMQSVEKRDGHPCNPDEIFLCDGASAGVHLVMRAFIRGDQDAILTPIPQYPLYSATLALNGGTLVPYYLDEEKGWQMDIDHLRSQVSQVCHLACCKSK